MIGVMSPQEAVKIARERHLDLVEVAPQAQPPVCRIIDFGKYQYEQKKRAHEAKRKQVVIEVKEIKFRPATDDHDYNFKMKHAKEILLEGNKVKATVRFRGREITHKELGMQLLQRLEKDLKDNGIVEVRPRVEGMQMTAIFAAKKVDKQQHEKPKAKPPEKLADRPAERAHGPGPERRPDQRPDQRPERRPDQKLDQKLEKPPENRAAGEPKPGDSSPTT